MFKTYKHSFTINDKTVHLETGQLARQADSAVLLKVDNMMLLATVVAKKEIEEDIDFFPLSIEYTEKFAAAGKIPGGFIKREGKPSDREVLISRLIDRALRPMFPDWYKNAVQVNVMLISYDSDIFPEDYAALVASTALYIAPNIPFATPISEVRVVKNNGILTNNPIYSKTNPVLEITVAGTETSILMVEGESGEISEDDFLEAVHFAHQEIKKQCKIQAEFALKMGINKKEITENIEKAFFEKFAPKSLFVDEEKQSIIADLDEFYNEYVITKATREARLDEIFLKHTCKHLKISNIKEATNDDIKILKAEFSSIKKNVLRKNTLNTKKRIDNRALDEIRNIDIEVGFIPSAHGSCLFTRGETQSLSTTTLGTKLDEQILDGATYSGSSRFMLHYNFPGFSVGEVKASRSISKREIGHGNLALRALKRVLPPEKDHGYTIRVVSDILESSGSSSMATVCSGSLSLMDSGIQISGNVSGIAMGLIIDGDNYVVLSDISGMEDAIGDMDFKVAGTERGITACQMDIKVQGISFEILKNALAQAKKGREHILNKMNEKMKTPRSETKEHAPKNETISVNKKFIGAIIGPGGKSIQEIQKSTGATLFIEEKNSEGLVSIYASNKMSLDKAKNIINNIVKEPEVNAIYKGKVKSVLDFGAFVEFLPGKEGMVHVSEVKWGDRIENLQEILKPGEEIEVKLLEIDKKGKYKLSIKSLLPNPE